jgi:hypothetical protein
MRLLLEIVAKHANILLKPDVENTPGALRLPDSMRPGEQSNTLNGQQQKPAKKLVKPANGGGEMRFLNHPGMQFRSGQPRRRLGRKFLRVHAVTLAVALVALALTANHASASIILASSYNTPDPGFNSYEGHGGLSDFPLEQQFTLVGPVIITSVDADMACSFGPCSPNTNLPASDLGMYILSDVSNNPGAVLATDTVATGTVAVINNYSDINFAFNPIILGPGTYWLAATSINTATPFDWLLQAAGTVDPAGPGGTINRRDDFGGYPGGTFDTTTYLTSINGVLLPEPSTVMTSLGALAFMLGIARRRRG